MTQVLCSAAVAAALAGSGGAPAAVHAQAASAAAPALVNPNSASEADLARLPHMNAAIVRALSGQRPFSSMTAVDMLLTSHGLTKPQSTELYRRMFIPLDLNAASDAEILLIPNLGNRMLHEFKEYRPYKAIAQFRREIGKYVSKDEVARLERYVVVR